jgi:molecular chaperone GrpE
MKEDKKYNEIEKCKKEVIDLHQKVAEAEERWKRALADYKNLEKRTAEEKIQYAFFIKKMTIESFLPLLDNLEKIEHHIKDKGLELTLKDFRQTLSNMGVTEIEVVGKDFDHSFMEAVGMHKGEKNKVLKIEGKGYLLEGNLLRPAKVIVGQ